MGRGRLGIVALLCVVAVVGIPVPPVVAGNAPATEQRDVTIENGSVRTSSTQGASMERQVSSLPIHANMVATSFRSSKATRAQLEELVIEVRTRDRAGWSGWERLPVEPDEAPDAKERASASTRVFTGPRWVGLARSAEVRLIVPPGGATVSDLKLHLINTRGDARDPNPVQKAVSMVSGWLRGSSAQAMTVQPAIISRKDWGADESMRECCPRYAPAVKMAFVHHTAGSNSYAKSDSKALVRGIYAFHVKNRGWSDIGYNFLVDKYGQVFEGRYGGITLPVIGAHVKGFNTGSTGISLMGTFTSVTPTTSMVNALKNLLAWKMDVHHIPPAGTVKMTSGGGELYPVGSQVTFNRISGHRDGQQTSCPGWDAYKQLPSIRSAVSKIGLPKLYTNGPNVALVTPDGDGVDDSLWLAGTFSTTVSWKADLRWEDGTLIQEASGTGTTMGMAWNALDPDGTLTEGGLVKWTISATDGGGLLVRPAAGTFNVLKPVRLVGDWDGDGTDTPATVIGSKWSLHNDFDGEPDVTFLYGKPTDRPVAGDWDGDGKASPGIVRGNVWYLNNGTDPVHDISFAYGWATDVPISGDWNGDGKDTAGIVRSNVWYLNDNFDAVHDGAYFAYGAATDAKIAGDWDGDGKDTAGVVRANVWYLNNDRDSVHDIPAFAFGSASDAFVTGNWGKDGVDVPGVFREPKWYLSDEAAAVDAVVEFVDQT